MASQHAAVGENAGADPRPDGQKNGVACTGRRAPPALAENVSGAIAIDCEGGLRTERRPKLIPKRIVAPPGNVGGPHCAASRPVETRHADSRALQGMSIGDAPDSLDDESPHRLPATGREGR